MSGCPPTWTPWWFVLLPRRVLVGQFGLLPPFLSPHCEEQTRKQLSGLVLSFGAVNSSGFFPVGFVLGPFSFLQLDTAAHFLCSVLYRKNNPGYGYSLLKRQVVEKPTICLRDSEFG